MRQLLLDKKNLVVKEVAQPLLDDHAILVSVHYAYISADTKLHAIKMEESLLSNIPHKVKRVLEAVSASTLDKSPVFNTRYSLGYSCSGHVIAVGKKVRRFSPGDFVACTEPADISYGDLVCVPEHFAVNVKDKRFIKEASLTAIAATALQGVRRAQLQIGERVCVFGLGLLGQLTVQLAKRAGCSVVAVGSLQTRLDLAKKYGADLVLNGLHDDVAKEINLLTQQYGVDATIITADSKTNEMLNHSFQITRRRGRIVLTGDIGIYLNRDQCDAKELDILVSTVCYDERHDNGADWTEQQNMRACIELIEKGLLELSDLVAHEVGIAHLSRAYQKIEHNTVLGVVLAYEQETRENVSKNSSKEMPLSESVPRFIPAVSDTIRVGIIGVGEFAQKMLIPLISNLKNVEIKAVVDTDVRNSNRISQEYDASDVYVQEEDLLNNNAIDVVVISSPHRFHCDQISHALKKGKAVFVEKPMVTDFAQLQQLSDLLKQHPDVPFCVDYNRSFSPFMQKIKKVLAARNTPVMIQYRMNAGFLGKKHWIHSSVGAGRIIGEACQIVDLFYYLVGADPVSVSVEAMHASRDDIFPTDNFTAQISFNDGSVCSVLFTALGHPDIGMERAEFFFDEKAILMEEFMELYGFGLPSWFNETVTTPDKGHEALVNQFFNALKQDTFQPPISMQRLQKVAEITLLIDQLACEGGGKKEIS